MNEHKIRLIAVQASEWCKKNAHGAPAEWEWEYKFAELIVRECAGIYEAIDNGNKVQGTDNYLKALKLRFGEIK